jgi:putative Holliday junction resolvase
MPNKKYASIDVGLKRIGVAISVGLKISSPKEAILRKNRDQAARDVDAFLNEWEIDTLIVGYPGASIDMQNRIKHFVGLLQFDKEVIFQEENMSSIEAEELMRGEIKQKRDGRIDSIAAQIILDRYLRSIK